MDRVIDWLRNTGGTAAWLVRETLSSLRYNWGIAVLSIGLAVALWVFVTDRQNPDVAGRVPGTVTIEAVNLPRNQAVFSLSQSAVTVRVRAPGDVFKDLTAQDFRAVIDLSAVTEQQASVEVHVEPKRTQVEVVEITPATVDVQLEDVTSVQVPVQAHIVGTPPRGAEVSSTTVEPQEAEVTGPESLVDRVAAVEADVNLTGLPTTFEQTLLLHARDAQGGTIEGVTVAPEGATVRVEIVQTEFSATYVVVPDVTGTPAEGFRATGMVVEPQFVEISGTTEVFQGLDPAQGIHTEPIVIDGASADVVRPVALRLPQGARANQPTVTVRITIVPINPG